MSAPTHVAASPVLALAASTTRTLLLLNPAVVQHRLVEVDVSLDGAAAGAGIAVELYRTTTVGSPAGTTVTPARENAPGGIVAQTTVLANLTAEPSALEVLRQWFLTPFGGLLCLQFPPGREPAAVPGAGAAGSVAGQRLGLRVVTPASVAANVRSSLTFEE